MKTSDKLFAVLCVGIVVLFAGQKVLRHRAEKEWEKDLHGRLLYDFRRSREEVKDYVARYIPDVTDEEIDSWTESQKLENMVLDGELRYFRNAGPNLFRIDHRCEAIKAAAEAPSETVTLSGNSLDGHDADDAAVIPEIVFAVESNLLSGRVENLLSGGESNPYLAAPKHFHVRYTLTVDADAVPAGEKIRCWLPFPRKDHPRQKDVVFISASEPEYTFSDPECPHSTLYMEKTAVAGEPTVFSEEFEYTISGEWHPLHPDGVKPYNTSDPEYRRLTSERDAHIRFTPEIRHLADSLSKGIDNPYLLARKFFTYVNDNFPWASAREYSTVENIPMYVLESGHGDCGMVTLLFMTLCRYKGIPARWQSGFMMHPSGWNLHDWAEVYFEGPGWVPADQSFGIPSYALRRESLEGTWAPTGEPVLGDLPEAEFFYLGGIDPYRMIVNSDYGALLSPRKKFTRSETVDFQRGEVEWKGGNLYFDKWDYHLEIL